MTPTFPLGLCEIKSKSLTLDSSHLDGRQFPSEVAINSHHTGRTVIFRRIGMDHPMYDQDGWDGEQAVYEPMNSLKNVEILVIYNSH